jgi:hypothetical protein
MAKVKIYLCLLKQHAVGVYAGVHFELHTLLTLAFNED